MHTVQLKIMLKAQISGRMACIGIRCVMTTSVYSEKTRLNELLIRVLNKSQETMVFERRKKLTSTMKLRLEK